MLWGKLMEFLRNLAEGTPGYFYDLINGGPIIVGLLVFSLILFADYLYRYGLRGSLLYFQLRHLTTRIGSLGNKPRPELRSELDAAFSKTACAHAWSEYEETLHDQTNYQNGERQVSDVRATIPSEGFINLETIVDSRIGAEYFRHLPGIFTGMGIIGTFTGLIQGLLAFNPNVDADALKSSLAGLFSHVMHAFIFSALAIALAMIVTITEKWLYAACAKWVGQVSQKLDSLFRMGVGEEYLSKLLLASEDSATQTRQLKESFVLELKELLTQLTERQVAVTQQMSTDLGRQIESSLKEPLTHIADTVRQASGQQTSAASTALETLMRAFIDKMQETLGGQLDGLQEMMRASAQSMTQVEAAMRSLVGDMERVNGESTSGMQRTVQDLIERMTEHQRQQSAQAADNVSGLLARVESTVERLADQQNKMTESSERSLASLMGAVDQRVTKLAESNEAAQRNSASLAQSVSEISTKAITGLEEGALAVGEALNSVKLAVERLAQLTEKMSALQSGFGESANQIAQSSGVLGGASQSLSAASTSLESFSSRLEVVGKMVQTEGEARSDMLRDLKQLTAQSQQTGQSLAGLADEVNQKLAEMLDRFGGGISRVVADNLTAYNKQLSDAVGMLSSALEELAEVADARR